MGRPRKQKTSEQYLIFFLERTVVSQESSDGCWIYTRGLKKGYGSMYTTPKKYMQAHRFSYEYFNGPIPEGMEVCHECDNPSCVRPDHLFLGTHKQNYADAAAKGRLVRGSRQWNSKLTEADIPNIRALHAEGITAKSIAQWYGIGPGAIKKIINGRRWKHVP